MGLGGAVELAAVRRSWRAVVGQEVAAHCWPLALVHGRLVVATDHPAWASELRALSQELLVGVRAAAPSVQTMTVQVSPDRGRDW